MIENLQIGYSTLLRRAGRWIKDEDGSATIEAILWIPFYFALMLFVMNAGLIFYGQSQMMRIVQDGNRAFSIGRLENVEETQDFILERLAVISPLATVTTVLDQGIIYTTATVPVEDLAKLGAIDTFDGYPITVSSQHFLEF